jgi:hypothetical protein
MIFVHEMSAWTKETGREKHWTDKCDVAIYIRPGPEIRLLHHRRINKKEGEEFLKGTFPHSLALTTL